MPFDPFDERHRDKIKRRRPEEVAFEKRQWEERVDRHFKRALEEYNFPDYVESVILYQFFLYDEEYNLLPNALRRNTKAAMERLGYEKMTNENSKDGRWKTDSGYTVVYSKRGLPKIKGRELKQALAP